MGGLIKGYVIISDYPLAQPNLGSKPVFYLILQESCDFLLDLGLTLFDFDKFFQKFWFLAISFLGSKLGPKMDQNCINFGCVPFSLKCKIFINFSSTVFVLLKTTSGQYFSKVKQYLG